MRKEIILLGLALAFVGFNAFATENCNDLAIKAASQVYMLNEASQPILATAIEVNLKNSSNGVSLNVAINKMKYLVALTPSTATNLSSPDCSSVDYVIAYPYANLMPQ